MKRVRVYWRRHFLELEAIVAVLPSLALLIWFVLFGGLVYMDDFMTGVRTDLYRTTVTGRRHFARLFYCRGLTRPGVLSQPSAFRY